MENKIWTMLLAGAFAAVVTIGLVKLGTAAFRSNQASNYAEAVNTIEGAIISLYPSPPYTQGAQANATATLTASGQVPGDWTTADNGGATTPWGTQWLFQVAQTNLFTTYNGIPLEDCQTIVRSLDRLPRLATINLNGSIVSVSAVPVNEFSGALNDLSNSCTAGQTNQLVLTLN